MGQPITVVEKPSSNPAILRVETNRPLSGMGHERYTEAPPEILERPVDELARRLFATGDVDAVHIHGSIVTLTLRGGRTGAGLADVVRGLFRHYADGAVAEPTPVAEPVAEEPAPAEEPVPAEEPAPAEEPVPAEEPAPDEG